MLKEQIKSYVPINEQEVQDQKVMLDYIMLFQSNILTRENEFAHFTSSGFILNEAKDKVLMIYHNLYNSWAWTGGHADGEVNLLEVAMKEAKEETGVIHLRPLTNEIMSLDILPVWGHMKKGSYVSSHQHLNVSYLLVADETDVLRIKEDENSNVGWIPVEEIEQYCQEPQMIPIYKKLLQRVKELINNEEHNDKVKA